MLLLLVTLIVTLTQGQRPPCSRLITNFTNNDFGSSTSSNGEPRIWNASLNIPLDSLPFLWTIILRFSSPLDVFINQQTDALSGDGRQFVLRKLRAPKPNQLGFTPFFARANLTLRFTAHVPDGIPAITLESVHFDGELVCKTANNGLSVDRLTPASTPRPATRTQRYDYGLVIKNSLLFYEAQRSGKLPPDNRIPWRGDSFLQDRGKNGEDLTGGYFTSGRTLKFTFPIAAAITILGWGLINHNAGYQAADQLEFACKALDWGATYLARCHTKPDELYVLVGDVNYEIDNFWGRPEDINFTRPAFAINRTRPGSEVAAETAAALAASSVALKEYCPRKDPKMTQLYVYKAKQLYDMANKYRGDYHNSVREVTNFYKSWSSYKDELVWAALWLFRATGDERYRDEAQKMYDTFFLASRPRTEFSWDEKTLGIEILLSQMTLNSDYESPTIEFCDYASNIRTPKGLFHPGLNYPVGSIRYASNVAFICFELGEHLRKKRGAANNPYLDFAVRQVNYILGDTGRSYMIGFGTNYPKKTFHSASSCPDRPSPCGWEQRNSNKDNPHVLVGALVGGPYPDDSYEDSRVNFNQTDVGIDYNAGFQSLVAGLMELHQQNGLPNCAYGHVNLTGQC